MKSFYTRRQYQCAGAQRPGLPRRARSAVSGPDIAAIQSVAAVRRGRRQRGTTYVDLLMAALIMSIGLMGLVNTWVFAFRVTLNTDDTAVAYSLGRFAMERVKMSGFSNASEGTSTAYYNANESSVSASACRYQVDTYVASDVMTSGTSGQSGGVPSNSALRTVTVTVKLYSTGSTLYQSSTYLARAGI